MRMNALLREARPLLFVALSIALMSCDLSGIDEIGSSSLDKVSLSGPSTVSMGDTVRLRAVGHVTGLIGILFFDPLRDARFGVSNPTVAAITPFIPPPTDSTSSPSVLVTGLKIGTALITVSARGMRDSLSVSVQAPQ